jgi:hypothetical protein
MKRKKFKGILIPDVRSVDRREKKMNLRKGMRKGKTKGHDVWKVLQLPLFGNPYESKPLALPGTDNTAKITTACGNLNPVKIKDDDMEPDYIKKYKNVMK